MNRTAEELLEKIRSLQAAEVEDFVDFLLQRDDERRLARGAAKLSEAACQRV